MAEGGRYFPLRSTLLHGPEILALSPDAKLVLLVGMCLYTPSGIDDRAGIEEKLIRITGLTKRRVRTALQTLEASHHIETDRDVVWFVHQLALNCLLTDSNPKHRASIQHHVIGLPPSPLIDKFKQHYHLYFRPGAAALSSASCTSDTLSATPSDTLSDSLPDTRRRKKEEGNKQTEGGSAEGSSFSQALPDNTSIPLASNSSGRDTFPPALHRLSPEGKRAARRILDRHPNPKDFQGALLQEMESHKDLGAVSRALVDLAAKATSPPTRSQLEGFIRTAANAGREQGQAAVPRYVDPYAGRGAGNLTVTLRDFGLSPQRRDAAGPQSNSQAGGQAIHEDELPA